MAKARSGGCRTRDLVRGVRDAAVGVTHPPGTSDATRENTLTGQPSHFEVGVPDAERAKAFYGDLLGWTFETTSGADAWIQTGGVRGGLHGDDDATTIVVYFSVLDIDAAVIRVRELGGQADDPGPADPSGRYLECRDDQGLVFGLHEPARA